MKKKEYIVGVCVCVVCVSRSVVSDSLQPHGLQPTSLLCPWDFPGKSTKVGCHFLLQEVFPTQGTNLCLLHCKQILYHLNHQEALIVRVSELQGLTLFSYYIQPFNSQPKKIHDIIQYIICQISEVSGSRMFMSVFDSK